MVFITFILADQLDVVKKVLQSSLHQFHQKYQNVLRRLQISEQAGAKIMGSRSDRSAKNELEGRHHHFSFAALIFAFVV